MSCPDIDCKGYILNELPAPERRRVEAHIASCAACGEELRQLKAMLGVLELAPAREPLRPIRFVAEAVAEPGWWVRFWRSGPQLGFASAAMLSLALMVNAFVPRTVAQAPAPAPVVQQASAAQVDESKVRAEVEARVRAELKPVMAQMDERLKAYEERSAKQRNTDMRDVSLAFEAMQKRVNSLNLMTARYGGD